jgi:hypothetical protein
MGAGISIGGGFDNKFTKPMRAESSQAGIMDDPEGQEAFLAFC